jgi:hypothetical protein
MAKQYLGYHYDFFPGTRHDLLRPLNDVDWPSFAAAIRRTVVDGQTLILTGEDVAIHPGSGLSTYPHRDGRQLAAVAAALDGAAWSVITRDGDTIAASLGKGRMILCRESIDAAGNTNPELARWQKRWLAETGANFAQDIPAPTLKKLLAWWVGQEPITTGARSIAWFAGNQREIKLKLDPALPLGETFAFTVPPTGTVQKIAVTLAANAEGKIRFDVGCDGQADGEIAAAGLSADAGELAGQWAAAANRYLDWAATHQSGPYRDGSGWRVVPVRVTASGKGELILSHPNVLSQ